MKNNLVNLLRWSEKYTKTDMVDLFQGSFWVTLAQGLVTLMSILLVWVFANILTPEAYGEYRFLTTIVALLTLATLPGMTTAIVRAVARGNSGVIPEVISTRVKWGLYGALISFSLAGYYFWNQNYSIAQSLICIGLLVPFYQSYAVTNFYHNGRKDYKNYTLFTVIRRSVISLSTISVILLTKDVFLIITTYMTSTAVANYLIYRYTIMKFPLSNKTDKETIAYGKKLSLTGMVGTAASHLDKIFLWHLAGAVPVAIYSITTAPAKEIASAFGNIGTLALPKMANRDKRQLRQSLLHKIFIYFLVAIPLVILYILSAPFIFELFFAQYAQYVLYAQLSSGLILFTPLVLFSQYFNATMHTKAIMTTQLILPIVLFGLYFALIPLFGVPGAILAVIGRHVVAGVIMFTFFISDPIKN